MYWTCPKCGANLDFGEKCDCENECNRGALRGAYNKKLEKEKKYGQLQLERHSRRG